MIDYNKFGLCFIQLSSVINILKTSKTNICIGGLNDDELNLEKNLIENTFSYLFALSEYCSSHLCKNGVLNVLFDDYFVNNEDDEAFRHIATQLIDKLCEYDAKAALRYESKDEIFLFFESLIQEIEKRQDDLKFKLLIIFEKMIKMNSISVYLKNLFNEKPKLSQETIPSVFNDLIKSKNLKSSVKDVAFSILSFFIENNEKFLDEIYLKNKQLFYLISHLISIEIRIALEDNTKTLNDLSANRDVLLNRLSIYFTIFEKFIIFIAISPLIDTEVDEKQIGFVVKFILETINIPPTTQANSKIRQILLTSTSS